MGRPLKKSFFGSPATGGKQLVLSWVWLEGSTEAEQGYWIIRQVGTARYQVTNGTKTGVVKLVDAMPDAPGEGVIEVHPFGGITEYASKIHNRTVVTFDGNTYAWSSASATEEGQADFVFETWPEPEEPEAGWTITTETFGENVGYDLDGAGDLSAQPEDFTILSWFENNISNMIVEGDQADNIASISVTIGGTTVVYGFYGQEGNSEFLSEDSFGFEDGETYEITSITWTAPV